MTGLIDGTDLPREVVHRTREQLQIIHQQRGGEDHLDLDASAEERVDGPCGENADGFLFGHQPESLVGDLAEEPEIDIGSADRVVAVSGDGYFAGFERGGGFGREGLADVALPDVAGVGHLDTVDIEFEDVVVRIFEDELLGREIPVEFKGAADPDVAVFALPFGADFRHFGRSEGSGSGLPRGVIVSRRRPLPGGFAVGDVACRPGFEGDGREDGFEFLVFESDDSIGGSVDADRTGQGLFLAGPVTGRRFVEAVGAGPYREIGVYGDERYGRGSYEGRQRGVGLLDCISAGRQDRRRGDEKEFPGDLHVGYLV